MLEEIEDQHTVENLLTEDCRKIDDLHEIMEAVLEETRKSDEHTVQMTSLIASPEKTNSKDFGARSQMACLNYRKEV